MSSQNISGGVVHDLTTEIRQALADDQKALVAWEGLTPLARNEWICWVTFAKKAETRDDHLNRLIKELKQGKRRPCCWLGCTHRTDKAISPSVQAVLKRQLGKSA